MIPGGAFWIPAALRRLPRINAALLYIQTPDQPPKRPHISNITLTTTITIPIPKSCRDLLGNTITTRESKDADLAEELGVANVAHVGEPDGPLALEEGVMRRWGAGRWSGAVWRAVLREKTKIG